MNRKKPPDEPDFPGFFFDLGFSFENDFFRGIRLLSSFKKPQAIL
jgi:hypothetical protein